MNALPAGTRLALRFRAGPQEVRVAAEVVHTMPQFGMGVRFLNLSGEGRAAIEAAAQGAGLADGRRRTSKTTPVELPGTGRNRTRSRSRPRMSRFGSGYSTSKSSPGRSSKSDCVAIGSPSATTSKAWRRDSPPQ